MNKNKSFDSRPQLPNGVIFNAYPDSIGQRLTDTVTMLERPELRGAFSLFYILPTLFHSDLDRGFCIVDYELNEELVCEEDLDRLAKLGIGLKLDLVLNHLSTRSPQFIDLLLLGDESEFKDFFIDWNAFWQGYGEKLAEGYVLPDQAYLDKLFMRKPELPILRLPFPDNTYRFYWNTFYYERHYRAVNEADLAQALQSEKPSDEEIKALNASIAKSTEEKIPLHEIALGRFDKQREAIIMLIERSCRYHGQMDLNAQAEKVWSFYKNTLERLRSYGCALVRLDAFAYLHKQPGEQNFFNKPGTWEYLDRIRHIMDELNMVSLPEIHFEYGKLLHKELARHGYPMYDFFFPGLVIHAIEQNTSRHLLRWINELIDGNIQTINTLGTHDGIPVLDLKSHHDSNGRQVAGLLEEEQIEKVVELIMERGGRVKNLYGADGKKISYYQVNATFFSALGEDERKLLLARAIQLFMPGVPQIWYLDLFAGCNDYAAADKGGAGGHKEINRTTLSLEKMNESIKLPIVQQQLELIKLRNRLPAFQGSLSYDAPDEHRLVLCWEDKRSRALLEANLSDYTFSVSWRDADEDNGQDKLAAYNALPTS